MAEQYVFPAPPPDSQLFNDPLEAPVLQLRKQLVTTIRTLGLCFPQQQLDRAVRVVYDANTGDILALDAGGLHHMYCHTSGAFDACHSIPLGLMTFSMWGSMRVTRPVGLMFEVQGTSVCARL
jgi:hypothetical protein